jgi:hypothetical protein
MKRLANHGAARMEDEMQLNHKETYHQVRRALTTVSMYGDKRHVSHPYGVGDAKKKAQSVKVPRGGAEFREKAVRALLDRRPERVPTLKERLEAHIARKYRIEIDRRGGETFIAEKDRNVFLGVVERRDGLVLLRADGWRQYSRAFGARPASLAYLCGMDDNGPWAVRVPGTTKTIADAVDKLEPAEARKAREDGKQVLRQGDVYAVERKRDAASQADLPENHIWNAETRTIKHADGHGDLRVPFNCKFVPQTTLRMGRLNTSQRTGRGD